MATTTQAIASLRLCDGNISITATDIRQISNQCSILVNFLVTFLSGTCGRFGRLFLDIEIKERRLADVDARNDGRDHDVTEMCETSAH
jgi:hypothetical protein